MIVLDELTRQFQPARPAVDRLSFEVNTGEVYGLLGPNGAGKTTTLRMILGLLAPTSGEAYVQGLRVSTNPQEVKRNLGLVSASSGLYQWLTPRELLHYFGAGYGLSRLQASRRADELASVMELQAFFDQRCATLSTGQKQRVNMARALMHDPPVILLDEPTRGLDVVGSQIVFDYVAHLRTLNKAIVVCTHQLDEAERLCDRFGLLHRGQLRFEGNLDQLKQATGQDSLVEMFLRLLREQPQQEIVQ